MRTMLARITPRHVLIVTGVVIVTLVLTIALRNTVRELVVMPLGAAAWIAGLLVNSVPQAAWLGVLVLIGAFIVIRSLSRGTGATSQPAVFVNVQPAMPTRLAFWVSRLSSAKSSPYAAERALNEMHALVIDCLAHDYRVPKENVLDLVRKNALNVPADVRALLLEDRSAQPGQVNRLRDFVEAMSALLTRLTRREPLRDTAMPPEFQRKVTVMLNYVEGMNIIN